MGSSKLSRMSLSRIHQRISSAYHHFNTTLESFSNYDIFKGPGF